MPELSTLSLDQESVNVPASMQEQTRGQVAIYNGPYGGIAALETTSVNSSGIVALGQNFHTGNAIYWQKVRQMRRHPTINLVRRLTCACMASAQWSVEEDADAVEGSKDILNDLLPFQTTFLASALPGVYDWGWAPFEKIFYWDSKANRTKLRKLKPLLQDYTRIMITAEHGKFAGFKQFNKFLGISNSLLINQNVEGSYLYGESTMASIEPAYDRWIVTDRANVAYDRKVAGAHWVVHYPAGNTIVDGQQQDNFAIAVAMLRTLESSGSIAVPTTVQQGVVDLNKLSKDPAWQIEIVSADSSQGSFATRMQYLDGLMVRGGGFPERSILEGQYGTKAEAGEHADFAIMLLDFNNKCIADIFNWHLGNQLLRMNLGQEAENRARIKVAPIADDKKDFLKQVFLAALSNPGISATQWQSIDMHAVNELLEVPMTDKDDDGDQNLNNMMQMLQSDPGQLIPDEQTNPQNPNQPPPNPGNS